MKWIKLKDHKPEIGTSPVIVFVTNPKDGAKWIQEADYDGQFTNPYYGQETDDVVEGVTHWFIPKPPL